MTGVTIEGRALARNGAVTLDTDTISRAACAPPQTTSTTISSSANPSDAGQPVTFTSTVTAPGGGAPTGQVTFLGDGTPLGTVTLTNGQATLTATLSPGSHTITAVYLGTTGFDNSASPDLTQVVTQQQVTTTTTTAGSGTTTTTTGGTTTSTTAPPAGTPTGGPGESTTSLPRTGTSLGAAVVAGLLITVGTLVLVAARPKPPSRPLP
ncbi:MAG TPA: Ig-like domain-containing protein [Acidimicrobiales bacterium]|nr:Ig-like domain-containing protein [Acidimicrobiales bacterium]